MTSLNFHFFGVPVRIHLWFLLSTLLLGSFYAGAVSFETPLAHARWLAVWVAIVFQGVFCHEVGHALVGRAYGLTPRIDLVAFGGQTSFVGGKSPVGPGRSLLVSAAGPAVSVTLGLLTLSARELWLEPSAPTLVHLAVDSAVLVNLVWGLLNLLPMLPLDGGQIMMSLSELISPKRGRYFAAVASLLFAGGAVILLVLLQQAFLAVLAALFAWTSFQIVRHEQGLSSVRSDDPLGDAKKALRDGQGERLRKLGMLLLDRAQTPEARDEALHLLAWAHVLEGDPADAAHAMAAFSTDRPEDPALEGAILLDLGRPDDALPYFERAFERGGPFVRTRAVRAILEAKRFAEAVELFADDKGRDFSATEVDKVYRGALEAGELDNATELAKAVYHRDGRGETAVEVARCLARATRLEEALSWLEKARLAGYTDLAELEADPELGAIRALPRWPEVRADFLA